jgi:hypothetical protein
MNLCEKYGRTKFKSSKGSSGSIFELLHAGVTAMAAIQGSSLSER